MIFDRVAKNTGFIFSAQVANAILQLGYTIAMARYLGVEDFGKFSFAYAFTQLFVVAIDLGLNTYTVREVSKDRAKANSFLVNSLALKVVISIFVWLIIALFISTLNYPADTRLAVYILGFGLFLYSINISFNMVLQAFEKLNLVALNTVLFFSINIILGISFLLMGMGIVALAAANCLAWIITLIIGYKLFCKYCFVPKLKLDPSIWMGMLKYSLPIGVGTIFFAIYTKIDVTLISLIKGDQEVGYYTAAYRIIGPLSILPQSFFISVFPLMSFYSEKSSEHIKIILRKSFRFMAMASMPLVFGIYMLSPRIINLLYGPEYSEAVLVLRILTCSLLFTFIGNTFMHLLLSSAEGSKEYTVASGLGAFVNLTCNFIMIPLYGIKGAAISALVTAMVVAGSYYFYTNKRGIKVEIRNSMIKPLLAALIMAIYIGFIAKSNLFLIISSSAILYFLLLIVVRGFEPDEITAIKKIIKMGGVRL